MSRVQRNLFLAALLLATLMVGGCKGVEYNWGWYEILPSTEKGASNLKFLFGGIWLTVALSSVSIFFSVLLGLFVSLPGLSNNYYVRGFNRIYVETFRSIPVLVLILWVYYGLPVVLGLDALGFSYAQKMWHIILPQAIRRILPPLGNQFVYMLKMSSLLSIIGLQELTRKANELTVTVYRPLEIYTVLVLEYLVLILIVSWIVRRLEVRLGSNVQAAHR
jgi:polar amino acid transport system permease protein